VNAHALQNFNFLKGSRGQAGMRANRQTCFEMGEGRCLQKFPVQAGQGFSGVNTGFDKPGSDV